MVTLTRAHSVTEWEGDWSSFRKAHSVWATIVFNSWCHNNGKNLGRCSPEILLCNFYIFYVQPGCATGLCGCVFYTSACFFYAAYELLIIFFFHLLMLFSISKNFCTCHGLGFWVLVISFLFFVSVLPSVCYEALLPFFVFLGWLFAPALMCFFCLIISTPLVCWSICLTIVWLPFHTSPMSEYFC